jgi:transcriptional regulatory protein AMDR
MHYTELCRMISIVLRERFGLRVSRERRKAVLAEADKALANWSLMLPDTVRMSSADVDSWPALLHLTYNNFLILLHRPHPRASAYSDDYGPHDAEICSAAAGVIVSIFEELREKDRIKYLWVSSVNALFTAMIQVKVELRFSNPVLAINALRLFDSTMCSLRKLAEYWLTAETVLRVFETSKRLRHDIQVVKMKEPSLKPRNGEGCLKEPEHAPPSMAQSPGPHLNAWPAGSQYADGVNILNKSSASTTVADLQQADRLKGHSNWRQLFPFNDLEQGGSMIAMDFPGMEDEWRELYLNEPPMSDYFNDGSWMPEVIPTS